MLRRWLTEQAEMRKSCFPRKIRAQIKQARDWIYASTPGLPVEFLYYIYVAELDTETPAVFQKLFHTEVIRRIGRHQALSTRKLPCEIGHRCACRRCDKILFQNFYLIRS